jgi:hypothetical protein
MASKYEMFLISGMNVYLSSKSWTVVARSDEAKRFTSYRILPTCSTAQLLIEGAAFGVSGRARDGPDIVHGHEILVGTGHAKLEHVDFGSVATVRRELVWQNGRWVF